MSLSTLHLSDGAGGIAPLRLEPVPLGSGGDGSVYASASHPDLVAKLYHDPDRDPERRRKLLAMLGTPPRLDPIHHGGHRYVQLTWPTHLVEDAEGRFRGYAMPRVELDRAVLAESLLSRKTRQGLHLPGAYGLRVAAASNLAGVVQALHARGHHVVDLKPLNAYVYRDTFFVALLDCDGFSVQGASGERFAAHQYTPDYIAPEALAGKLAPEALGEAQDRFALATVVFQLLNGGVHPYQGVPAPGVPVPPSTTERMMRGMYAYGRRPNPFLRPSPWSIHQSFDDATRDLFDRAFGGDPAARPDAGEWRRHLAHYADPSTGALRPCAADPDHALFAAAPSAECPQCALDAQRGAAVQAARLRPAPAPAPHSPTRPAPVPPAVPSPVQPPAGARRWARQRLSIVAGVAGIFAAVGLLVALAVRGMPAAADVSSEGCPVPLDSIAAPDDLRALLARAAALDAEGRADELRTTYWSTDDQWRNAVHWSVRLGNQAATRALVLAGAPADRPDYDRVTPLMVAAGRADAWHVEFLLANGAKANARNVAGQTPLMYLASSCAPRLLAETDATLPRAPEAALLRLVAAGADLDAYDRYGHTALMHATRGSGLRVRDLLAAGADPRLEDWRGTHLHAFTLSHYDPDPDSPDRRYIQALITESTRAAAMEGWTTLPPEGREALLARVDSSHRGVRDHPERPPVIPRDSLYILRYRP
jgi:hypothetical protein